jgi:hypothetical protein
LGSFMKSFTCGERRGETYMNKILRRMDDKGGY